MSENQPHENEAKPKIDTAPEIMPSETSRFWRLNSIMALKMMQGTESMAQDPEHLAYIKANKIELDQLQARENAVLARHARILEHRRSLEKQPGQDMAHEEPGGGIFADAKNNADPEITQRALIDRVQKQFHVNGAKYHFKDRPDKVAFIDQGKRMATSYNDERVAKALVMLAEAKGWQSINVKGHPDFRREVWLAASIQGLAVRGHKPSEQDLTNLEHYQQRTMQNAVEKGEINRQQAGINRPNNPYNKTEITAKSANKVTIGRLLEHGEAKYNHDPNEKLSYYVKLDTGAGEKLIWGIDLKRVLTESRVQVGEKVTLQYLGSKPVQVESIKRDDTGKMTGKELIDTKRNTWEISRADKEKVIQAVAEAVISAKTKNPAQAAVLKAAINKRLSERMKSGKVPDVPLYDNQAARKINPQERIRKADVPEKAKEQTR